MPVLGSMMVGTLGGGEVSNAWRRKARARCDIPAIGVVLLIDGRVQDFHVHVFRLIGKAQLLEDDGHLGGKVSLERPRGRGRSGEKWTF
jgi:hypothetical protein